MGIPGPPQGRQKPRSEVKIASHLLVRGSRRYLGAYLKDALRVEPTLLVGGGPFEQFKKGGFFCGEKCQVPNDQSIFLFLGNKGRHRVIFITYYFVILRIISFATKK